MVKMKTLTIGDIVFEVVDKGAVRFDEEQTLTDEEKALARVNVGVDLLNDDGIIKHEHLPADYPWSEAEVVLIEEQTVTFASGYVPVNFTNAPTEGQICSLTLTASGLTVTLPSSPAVLHTEEGVSGLLFEFPAEDELAGRLMYVYPEYAEFVGSSGLLEFGNTTGDVTVSAVIPEVIHPINKKYIDVIPTVTAEDEGKFLRVVDGAWAAVSVTDGNTVAY